MKTSVAVILGLIVSGIGFVRAEDSQAPAAAAPAQAAPAAAAAPATIKVEKIAIGAAIDNKEISGEAAQFPSSTDRVYCWTKVTTDQTPVTVKHVWYADGAKEAEVSLDIKYPSMRTWSSKTVHPGSWKVDVTDDQGKVLTSSEFTVTKEAAAVPPAAAPAGAPATKEPAQVGQ